MYVDLHYEINTGTLCKHIALSTLMFEISFNSSNRNLGQR